MTITVDVLKERLTGKALPGGSILIEAHEAAIIDDALRATDTAAGIAHPFWFIAASLRCMGISVDQLCELAGKSESDLLLFGRCDVEQQQPLLVGSAYTATASIADVGSKTTRDGSRLDHLDVIVTISDAAGDVAGSVTSRYLFKRGNR